MRLQKPFSVLSMHLFDDRWNGVHGIGRFAAEIRRRLPGYADIRLRGRPADAIDPFRLSIRLRVAGARFFFSPGYNAPFVSPCDFAFTVHDLNHISVPENGSALKRLYYNRILRPALHRAAVILTVSEFSRQQICSWSGVHEDKIVNVGNGISGVFCQEGGVGDSAGGPYFVCMGSARPHKNFSRIVRAFAASGLGTEVRLLVIGAPSPKLNAMVEEAGVAGSVEFTGVVPDSRVAEIYRGSLALVFPSLYEGFGLPIIEAMACGTPVITANVTAMPEVAGNAAVLVDPLSVTEIAEAMRAVFTDDSLRSRLSSLGRERACIYSWDETARRARAALLPWHGG